MDYQKFRLDYEASGLSQKAFGELRSMSSSMVSYYLRRTREEIVEESCRDFQQLRIEESKMLDRVITIITPDGMKINIPV